MGEPLLTTELERLSGVIVASPAHFRELVRLASEPLPEGEALHAALLERYQIWLLLEAARSRLSGARWLRYLLELGAVDLGEQLERLRCLLASPRAVTFALRLDLESDFFVLVEHADASQLTELAALVQRLPRGSIVQGILAECVTLLVQDGRVDEALDLVEHISWLGYVVRATVALLPHVEPSRRARLLERAWLKVQACPRADVYQIEPLLGLVPHFQPAHVREARLRSVESMIEALPPEDLQPSQDFRHPLIHLARTHATLGRVEHATALIHSLSGLDLIHGALLLAESTEGASRLQLGRLALVASRRALGRELDGFSMPLARIASLDTELVEICVDALHVLELSHEEHAALSCDLAAVCDPETRAALLEASLERAWSLRGAARSSTLEDVWQRLLETLHELDEGHRVSPAQRLWLAQLVLDQGAVELLESFAPFAPPEAIPALLELIWRRTSRDEHTMRRGGALRAAIIMSERLAGEARARLRARCLSILEEIPLDEVIWARLEDDERLGLARARVLKHRHFLDVQRTREQILAVARALPSSERVQHAAILERSPLWQHERDMLLSAAAPEPEPPCPDPDALREACEAALAALIDAQPDAHAWWYACCWRFGGAELVSEMLRAVTRVWESLSADH